MLLHKSQRMFGLPIRLIKYFSLAKLACKFYIVLYSIPPVKCMYVLVGSMIQRFKLCEREIFGNKSLNRALY